MTEPLEVSLRAQFGHSRKTLNTIAVIEPLEVFLRAQFGHSKRSLPMIAVTEPLEPSLRAQFGRARKPDCDCCNRALRRSCKARENVSKEEYTLSATTFEGRGSTAAIRKGAVKKE